MQLKKGREMFGIRRQKFARKFLGGIECDLVRKFLAGIVENISLLCLYRNRRRKSENNGPEMPPKIGYKRMAVIEQSYAQ